MLRMTYRNTTVLSAAAVAVTAAAVPARAQHSDISPRVIDGRIVTYGHDDATGQDVPDVRVFGYDFGEVVGDPYFSSDPGVNAPAGSGLPAGSLLRFDIPAASSFGLPSNLSFWGGSGPVTFGAVPSSETLRFTFGSANTTVGSGAAAQDGFGLGAVAADGSLHRHLSALLNGSDGNNDPADGNPPAPGIYLVPMVLGSSDPAVLPSAPVFVVYNNGLTEEAHDEAIDYVQTNVVPEPASAGLAAITSAALLLRRRRDAR